MSGWNGLPRASEATYVPGPCDVRSHALPVLCPIVKTIRRNHANVSRVGVESARFHTNQSRRGGARASRTSQPGDRVFASFEIVDSRIAGWDITLVDTVADNASSGLYVLGNSLPRDDAPNLAEVTMMMTADGEQLSAGKGSDCLGSPWEAQVWLANTSLHYGSPLRAGELILSGALGPMVPVAPGVTYSATISGVGVGDVTTTFRPDRTSSSETKAGQYES